LWIKSQNIGKSDFSISGLSKTSIFKTAESTFGAGKNFSLETSSSVVGFQKTKTSNARTDIFFGFSQIL
jgi:hypothetical protein